jgi:hypothetical protein
VALNINRLKQEVPTGDYVSPERICVTADDEIVACDDPRAERLLVGEGSVLPRAEAERYGLIGTPAAVDDDEDAQASVAGPEDTEVVEVQVGGAETPTEVLAGKVADVAARIATETDAGTLRILLETENGSGRPRKGVVEAIEARLSELDAG